MSYVNTVDSKGDAAICTAILHKTLDAITDTYCEMVGGYAFYKFLALHTAIFANARSIEQYAFAYCSALKTIEFPLSKSAGYFSFYECTKLEKADFPCVTSVGRYAFNGCTALKTLILRSETLATLSDVNALEDTPIESGKGYIYVPGALVDSYKADSKWSAYKFRKLEDYTVDGTVTGEVDPNRCRVRFFNDDGTLLGYVMVPNGGTATYAGTPVCSEDASWEFEGFVPEPTNVTEDMDCYAQYKYPFSLETASWAKISEISAEGTAANYMAVGDVKPITFGGYIGQGCNIPTSTYYVYILGFDHNSEVEGKGIHFGCFKVYKGNTLTDVSLISSGNGSQYTEGLLYFNANHWGSVNYGGWKASDIRYDILGSTDVAPSGYGSAKTSGVVGYDATTTCATNPVANTLMSCLPEDLRAVMKPITKWTNNVGDAGDTEDKVTSSVDYLPLLAQFEVTGSTEYANSYEKNYQKQYEYFVVGNSAMKFRHTDFSVEQYLVRSPGKSVNGYCVVYDYGQAYGDTVAKVSGLAPIFMV